MFQKDKTKSFIQELDEWTDRVVIDPLVHDVSYGPDESVEETAQVVRKAVRDKSSGQLP